MTISKSFLNCDGLNIFNLIKPMVGTAPKCSFSFSFTTFEDLNEIALKWSLMDLNSNINPWLSYDFQKNMLTAMPENVKVLYGSYSFGNEVKGYFPIYFFDFSLDKSLREKNLLKRILGKFIKAKILLMGQIFATGTNYPFSEYLREKQFQIELHYFLQSVYSRYKAKAILWKDFFSDCGALEQNGYFSFKYQPAMIMNIDNHWETMYDYEQSLTSKYRIRLLRARNKMKDITWKTLTKEEIINSQTDLHNLYVGILTDATFKMATVPESYFLSMKEAFKDNYNLTAGYLNGNLVCFYSTLINGETLEANLAGFEEESNLKMQLYLNMLFLMVENAIKFKVRKLNFYRTAMEIKSSVGAEGKDTIVYIKPTDKWLAPLFPILIPWFSPQNLVWKARSPFKTNVS
ncbi:MAG: hypothetical protein ACK5ZX_06915 [Bacteroidota bacterium]